MLTLVIFLLAVYGLANAFRLKIGQWFFGRREARRFLGKVPYVGDLFYCPPCLSFWIGMLFSFVIVSPAFLVCPVWWKAMILDGLAACGVTWLLHVGSEKMADGLDI